jgi:hypothetical protein
MPQHDSHDNTPEDNDDYKNIPISFQILAMTTRTDLTIFEGPVNGKNARIMLDSGATGCFVSKPFITRDGMMTETLSKPESVRIANGKTLHITEQARLTFRLGKYEHSRIFKILDLVHFGIILGKDWLKEANPRINWRTETYVIPYKNTMVKIKPIDVGQNMITEAVDSIHDLVTSNTRD